MTEPHLDDPLGYLYEELPPDRMAEARRHLASCPECVSKLRRIKETVKAYRALPASKTPAGLRARVMAAVPKPVFPGKEAGGVLPTRRSDLANGGLETIRDSLIISADMLPMLLKRRWYFHPAWPVAVAVIFVCTVLIQFSPRKDLWFRPEGGERQAASRSEPRHATKQGSRESTASAAEDAPSSTPVPKVPPRADSAAAEPRTPLPVDQIAEIHPSGAQPAPPPPELSPSQREIAEPTISAPMRAARSDPRVADFSAPLPMAPVAPPVPDDARGVPPVPAPSASSDVSIFSAIEGEDNAFRSPDPPSMTMERKHGAILPEIALPAESPVILDLAPPGEPPQIIPRPQPFDSEKIVANLTFLIGIHIGNGDVGEARKTVDLLGRYDKGKAREFMDMLDVMEEMPEADDEATTGRGEPPAPKEAAPDTLKTGGTGEPASAPEPPAPEAAAPDTPEVEGVGETASAPEPPAPETVAPGTPEAGGTGESASTPEPPAPEAAAPDTLETGGTGEPASAPEPPAPKEAAPDTLETGGTGEPASTPEPPAPEAAAPDTPEVGGVEKSDAMTDVSNKPDANPPTLWESGGLKPLGLFPRLFRQRRDPASGERRRNKFTTDPYERGD